MMKGMYSWAQKRQTLVAGILLLGIVVFAFISWRILFSVRASCADGVQNNGERGVDCDGSCALVCRGEALSPLVHFVRAAETGNGVFGAVAYLENRNPTFAVRAAPFVFKLYDGANLLVAERHGVAPVPPGQVFAIYEGGMAVKNRIPTRATFSFTEPIRFERVSPLPPLSLRRTHFETGAVSRLEVVAENPSLHSLQKIRVTALLFGADGNLFAASATEIPTLRARGSVPISFTWPRPLLEPTRIELLASLFAS